MTECILEILQDVDILSIADTLRNLKHGDVINVRTSKELCIIYDVADKLRIKLVTSKQENGYYLVLDSVRTEQYRNKIIKLLSRMEHGDSFCIVKRSDDIYYNNISKRIGINIVARRVCDNYYRIWKI